MDDYFLIMVYAERVRGKIYLPYTWINAVGLTVVFGHEYLFQCFV